MRTELAAGLLFCAALAGCPGELQDPERFTDGGAAAACTDAPKDVFAKSCIDGCHSATASASSGDLDLESAGLVGRLKDKKAKGGAGLLLDSSDVDKSVLLTKLKSPPPFGSKMPFGEPALSDAQIKCARDWMAAQIAGAPSDAGVSEAGADAAKDAAAKD